MLHIKPLLKSAAYKLLHILSFRKAILFESLPDCSDNTKAVFDEMVRRGLHRKYEFIWMLHGEAVPENPVPHVRYIPGKGYGLKYRFAYFSAFARAKCILCCNGFLLPVLKSQKSFFLAHGTPIKSVRNYYTVPTQIHYCFAASVEAGQLLAYESNYPESRMIALGYPRNDVFSAPAKHVKPLLQTTCKKVIVWYPTFRQHKNGMQTGSQNAVPILHDLDAAKELNACACECDILIVMKPHFAQDLTQIKKLGLSNIRFIDDSFFTNHQISSYEFVAGCDALITDYSSIYYDYTLADKPVAVVWEDVEEYRKTPGFAVDLDYYMKGAEKIYDLKQFKNFLENVASGKDILCQQRREIRDLTNYSTDGKNTERVVDFIQENAYL